MKKSLLTLITSFVALALFSPYTLAAKEHQLFQVATYSSLSSGVYEGDLTYGKLKKEGNFGLGTFNNIDGEMVALNGRFYRIESNSKSAGKLIRVKDDQKAPFAEVIFFRPFRESNITDANSLKELSEMIEERLPNKNIPYAIEIEGGFRGILMRSFHKQETAYRPLSSASAAKMRLHNVSGSLIGFWFPKYWEGIAPAGLHLHFINSTHSKGGHVLNVTVGNAVLKTEPIYDIKIYLPHTGQFANAHIR